MATIVERTPRRITISMSPSRWKKLQFLEEKFGKSAVKSEKHSYKHESLCGMFNSNMTQTELIEEYLKDKFHI